MNLPPVAVRTAYWLARELSPEAIAFTRAIALDEIDHPTEMQRVYVADKYDLALRIAQQPLEGPGVPPQVCAHNFGCFGCTCTDPRDLCHHCYAHEGRHAEWGI